MKKYIGQSPHRFHYIEHLIGRDENTRVYSLWKQFELGVAVAKEIAETLKYRPSFLFESFAEKYTATN